MDVTREQFGNKADEQGAAEAGADFSTINTGELPQGRRDVIEVDAEYVVDGMQLVPKNPNWDGFTKALGELREGPIDLMTAQLCEEPDSTGLALRRVGDIEVESNQQRFMEVSKRGPRENLVWYGMHPEYYGAMSGDRIMLRRDVLESQYSCKSCKGAGYDEEVVCTNCVGTCEERVEDQLVPCRACRVLGYGHETMFSCGHRKCEKCNGSGWRSGIVIPEQSQSEAITGVVVSVGPLVSMWKIGDRLIYSKFAGHTLSVSKNESFVMMRESEPLGILRQRG